MEKQIDQHELAEYLGVSTRTVRTLIKRGELPPPIRIGRKQIWLRDKFTRWLEGGGGTAPNRLRSVSESQRPAGLGRPRLPTRQD